MSEDRVFVDTFPIIAHRQNQTSSFTPQIDNHFGCVGMARDIGQGLLEDPENRCGSVGVQGNFLGRQMGLADDP